MRTAVLLAILLAFDVAFAGAHVAYIGAGTLGNHPHWNIELDRSYAEFFQYAKWAAVVACLGALLARRREALYAALGLLFLYLLIDDSFSIHETLGKSIASTLPSRRVGYLRAQDIGEVTVSAVAFVILFGAVTLAWLRSRSVATRRFTVQMLLLVVLLTMFGIVVDLLHIVVQLALPGRKGLFAAMGVIEDGGEMIAASLLVFWSACHLLAPRNADSIR